jgi:hypothetical protein
MGPKRSEFNKASCADGMVNQRLGEIVVDCPTGGDDPADGILASQVSMTERIDAKSRISAVQSRSLPVMDQ